MAGTPLFARNHLEQDVALIQDALKKVGKLKRPNIKLTDAMISNAKLRHGGDKCTKCGLPVEPEQKDDGYCVACRKWLNTPTPGTR